MTRFTILGAGGFIGRALAHHLRIAGHEVLPVARDGLAAFLAGRFPAGHVINCIGLTGDFRTRPRDTTREDSPVQISPGAPGELYAITKLAGEALCLSDPRAEIRVARLSNVYGAGMGEDCFLGQVIAEGRATGAVALRQGLLSCKDYIAIDDVIALLGRIAVGGRERLYNVATGHNTTHDAIAAALARSLGWRVGAIEGAAVQRFPRIDITRIKNEFGMPRCGVLDDLPALAAGQRQEVAC